jgi:dipeptidase D
MNPATEKILGVFETINAIPRCSQKEGRICQWLADWAAGRKFSWKQDKAGNLAVKVPATLGCEAAPGIVFQAHVDMVCEKTPDSAHDFDRDAIRHVREGDWLRADRTTLGADNGVAVAMGMVLAEADGVAHPPLELLFTVNEETGLNGAKQLDPGLVEGKILLNVDSEDEGVFTVGCAGGKDTDIDLAPESATAADGRQFYTVTASGMRGGHSGIDIGRGRANANQVLARALAYLGAGNGLQLAVFKGGTVHNAIPRDAEALVVATAAGRQEVTARLAEFEATVRAEYAGTEPDLALGLQVAAPESGQVKVLTPEATRRVVHLILALPHGVAERSPDFEHLVQTSSNLAVATLADGRLHIKTSQRSSVMSQLEALTLKVESIAALAGAVARTDPGYPAWPPDMKSPLLARCRAVYAERFGKEPVVEVIHAGLECAVIGARCPGLDMISFGPTMQNPHSPAERLFIPSVGRVWEFLVALLGSYAGDNSERRSDVRHDRLPGR